MWRPSPNPLLRFLLTLVLLIPCCLAVWWFGLRTYLLDFLSQLSAPIITFLLPDKITGLSQQGDVWLLRTSLSPIDNPLNLLAIPISTSRFSISFPLLWGLILATPKAERLKQLLIGTAFLIPGTLLIILLIIQFKLALNINHQAILTEVPIGSYLLVLPYADHVYYLMAVGRQLAMLVFPTLIPLLIWGLLNRQFIRIVILEGWLISVQFSKPATHVDHDKRLKNG